MQSNHKIWFRKGMQNGIPIALGYLAVSFTLGIAARNSGLNAVQAALASLTCLASAGEYAGFTLILSLASYLEMAIMEFIVNARYLLMSCSLSQKIDNQMPFFHRIFMSLFITDEIFALGVSVPEKLDPFYVYGMATVATPCWVLGTFLGVIFGNILPARLVSALSVGLYGMFIAIIIPPSRKNPKIAFIVLISMLCSALFEYTPVLREISSSIRIILLTFFLSLGAAVLFPVSEQKTN